MIFSEIAVLKYTPFVSHLNHPKGKKEKKNKNKIFLLTKDFPFYFKDFFSYTTLYLHGLVLFTQN